MDTQHGIGFVLGDMGVHFGLGVGIAMLDYSKIHVVSKKERVAEKKELVGIINRVLNSQPDAVVNNDNAKANASVDKMDVNGIQYAQNIAELKDYFIHKKVFKEEAPGFFKLAKEYFKNIYKEERINTASHKAKFWTAFGIELLIDTPMALVNFHGKAIESGLQGRTYSFAHELEKNLWEVPAMWLGLEVGSKLK